MSCSTWVADRERRRSPPLPRQDTLLGGAGYERVECDSYTPSIVLGGGGSLDDSVNFLFDNPMRRGLLGFVDEHSRDDVRRTVRGEIVGRYEEGVGIRLGAAAWVVTAQA
jgi:hypothetical protein